MGREPGRDYEKVKAEIAADLAAGMTAADAASKHRVDTSTIWRWGLMRARQYRPSVLGNATAAAVSSIKAKAVRRREHGKLPADPVTCERVYDGDESEFLRACDEFRTRTGKRFLYASDYLFVLKSLGYSRVQS